MELLTAGLALTALEFVLYINEVFVATLGPGKVLAGPEKVNYLPFPPQLEEKRP